MSKKKGRDAYGKLVVSGWHLEVSCAEIDNSEIFPLKRVCVTGTDHKGSWFSETFNYIVKCEHCRHCENRNNEEPYCHHHAMVVTPDYFCADGEEGEWVP